MENTKSITEKSWDEFRATGLFWWINSLLHIFGWCLVVEVSDSEPKIVKRCYPARTVFRGFDELTNDNGYGKVNQYMANMSEQIYKESTEDIDEEPVIMN